MLQWTLYTKLCFHGVFCKKIFTSRINGLKYMNPSNVLYIVLNFYVLNGDDLHFYKYAQSYYILTNAEYYYTLIIYLQSWLL